MLDAPDLPDDIAALKAMLIAAQAREVRKDERIERLEKLVAAFKQAAFGRKSEKADPEQFDLALEDLETAIAAVHAEHEADCPSGRPQPKPRVANRGSLPAHLPRFEEIIEPESRRERSAPLIADMRTLLSHHRARVAGKSPLGEALNYIAKHWDGLCVFLTDGRIEIDNNSVERTIRPIALNRKNALFAGHEAGAENWATIASLVETCKLNAVDPLAYLTSTLTAIVNGHKRSRIDELLPWNYLGASLNFHQ
ncbi:transposase [Rhizobium leguminosarum]|uniref:IS66 family transposase n=1 Tax=Rhizobium leguminosarum TaxID=384 RepID=UPI001C93DF58|nr:transposase [Rhizobium leguminosarum]MBY5818443.1 transposase [Rhizobium leguminosarum]